MALTPAKKTGQFDSYQWNLTPQTSGILENYTNTISDVDQSLKILIEGLKDINEPSVVVFFGDHLPMLGNDFDVYKEAAISREKNTYAEYLNKYSVPFIVWITSRIPRKTSVFRRVFLAHIFWNAA
jgi:phosphoglycerol transferase MdoB-like AlkP superfamily enzyme